MAKPRRWTKEDEQWLKDNYIEHGLKYCMKKLNRSQSSILHKASRLGVKRKHKDRADREYIYDGYIYISSYNERYALHRRVMENHIGRKLSEDELVHHIDGDKLNNDISNLEIVTRSEHMEIHYPERERCEKGRFL